VRLRKVKQIPEEVEFLCEGDQEGALGTSRMSRNKQGKR
jgi:hypothetical protein